MNSMTIIIYMIDLKDTILEVATSDQHYLQIKEAFQQDNF
jgi:hypothetical protein